MDVCTSYSNYWKPLNATNHTRPRQAGARALTGLPEPARVRHVCDSKPHKDPMAITIYHNPRCSKSRQTLEIIQAAGVDPEVVLYLKDTPTAAAIVELAGKLSVPVADLLRRGESEFKDATDLPDISNDAALAAWLADHPIVLERPIVVDGDKAVIGRPPENVEALLD